MSLNAPTSITNGTASGTSGTAACGSVGSYTMTFSSGDYGLMNAYDVLIFFNAANIPIFATTIYSLNGSNTVSTNDAWPYGAGSYAYKAFRWQNVYSLETVIKITNAKASSLNVTAQSIGDSCWTTVDDYDGVVRKISVDGIVKFATLADQAAWLDKFDVMQNGNQAANLNVFFMGYTMFVGTSPKPFRVMIESFTPEAEHTAPFMITYNLKLVERGPY